MKRGDSPRRLDFLRFLVTAFSLTALASNPSQASVVREPGSPASAPRYIISATREVAEGDYLHGDPPPCGPVPGLGEGKAISDALETWANAWTPPLKDHDFAGPLLRPDSLELVAPPKGVKLEGDIGRFFARLLAPRSTCTVLAVAVPVGSTVDRISYEAAENSEVPDRAWHGCSPGSDCLEGWSRFENARVFTPPSGSTIVTSIFMNWASDRARRARMNVYFTPPAGWTPKKPARANLVLQFPSTDSLESRPEARSAFQTLLRQTPPVEVEFPASLSWPLHVSRIFGLTEPALAGVATHIRNETYFLNQRLRGLTVQQVDKIIEGGGRLLVPAVPSYATNGSARTLVDAAADVWFGARDPRSPVATDGPRWIPSTLTPIATAVVRRPLPGESTSADDRLLLIEHDDFFLRDLERKETAKNAIPVLSDQITIMTSGQSKSMAPELASLAGIPESLAPTLAKASRKSTLYVLDTGWPTKEARTRALEWLSSVGGQGLGTITTKCEFRTPSGKGERHAVLIDDAVRPLMAMDKTKRVDTVYLPLGTMQCGGAEFLREVVRLSLIRRYRAFTNYSAETFSESIMKAFPAANPNDDSFQSDRVIVDAYLDLFDLCHRKAKDSYFINASWFVPDSLSVPLNTPKEGFIVAAVGNRGRGWNVFSNGCSFAGLAVAGERVVAVTCQESAANPTCTPSDTSAPKELRDTSLLLVRFDGSVGAECGTSFASPRVAWLLAAASAARPQDGSAWSEWVRNRIRASRAAGSPDFSWSEFMKPLSQNH